MITTNNPMKLLVLDIETSAHLLSTWGLFNQNIGINQIIDPTRMLSLALKWVGEPRLAYYSEFKDGRDAMVRAAFQLVDEADAVVHYNGKGFDMKHLNREFKEHDVRVREGLSEGPMLGRPSPYQHIDLLAVVKAHFKLASNKLDFVAGEFLKLGHKVKHPGFELWRACMDGDPKAWSLMEKYNKGDVVLTERVYFELLAWIDNHPNLQLFVEETGICGKCGDGLQSRGERYYATLLGTYPRFYCPSCKSWSRGSKSVFRADER
jgi:DNA polymerase elongation subunit (family B)